MSISNIGVIGAGQMGNGIAQVAAAAGFSVTCTDINDAAVARGQKTIAGSLARLVKKGTLTEEGAAAIQAKITWGTDLALHADADLIVEAATENVNLKFKIFEDISKVAKAGAILASNTSSISITAIAAHTDRPDRVIGMHFMNPVPLMQLVEIIRGLATTDEVYDSVKAAAEKMGKITVLGRDMPGFIVNRVLMPYINEAVYALYEGIGSVEDIDTAMKLGTNVPMGPLTLADFIGLDTCLAILEVLQGGLGDSKYRPCPLLRKYVEAGWLGRKSGRGFYSYAAKEMETRLERVGAVAVLTIDRPKALNALDVATLRGIEAALAQVGDARALVITGGGERAFVAGADIAAMSKLSAVEAADFAALGQRVFDAIESLPIPVIAAVNGFALGGGCELSLACDLVLAAPNAVFGQPEVKLGVIPGFGGTQRLVRRVGSMRARELVYTGRNVKAEEAVAIGLALRVVTEGSVKDAALAMAEQIAAMGPVAVRLAKRAILDGDGADLRVGLAGERTLFALCFATADQKEGMAAFLEKRPAAFRGE